MTSIRKKSIENDVVSDSKTGKHRTKTRARSQEGVRETVEAVAIAFVLAFVFKTFEAEAFVIPTGSMAPTLYGRHKEVKCEGCQLTYTIGASQEIDQETGVLNPGGRLTTSVCSNCRNRNDVHDAPVFNGDRIVVNKQVSKYRRFDVVVFKNPEEPHVNYIKRLVGLPGETVRIRQGDIQSRRSDAEPWVVQCKEDPDKQRDIQLLVYDDNYPPALLLQGGAEERWVPASWTEAASGMGGWPMAVNAWKPSPATRTYAVDATAGQLQWLRYRNLIPDRENWTSVRTTGKMEPALTPQLIADYCGFNSDSGMDDELYWVNDLTLDFTIKIESASENGQLLIELVEGFRTVRCQVDPVTGMADIVLISREGGVKNPQPETIASVQTEIKGPGEYNLAFANVDHRLCLWVNDALVDLGEKASFLSAELNLPTELDLAPIGIAASGLKAEVSDLVVRRDIYYRNDVLNFEAQDGISSDPASDEYRWQYRNGSITVTEIDSSRYSRLLTNLRNPVNYAREYEEFIKSQETQFGKALEFKLSGDEYLMFGDNSPASKDSRLFDYYSRPLRGIKSSRYAVREQDLIGEALCIFWPHGIPFLNNGKGFAVIDHKRFDSNGRLESDKEYPLYSVPFYPNISRMKLIR